MLIFNKPLGGLARFHNHRSTYPFTPKSDHFETYLKHRIRLNDIFFALIGDYNANLRQTPSLPIINEIVNFKGVILFCVDEFYQQIS